MTDFLSRLVDRVLGHALVAQPLIAPRFAQGAEIFGPDATPVAVAETESHRFGDEWVSSPVPSAAFGEKQSSVPKREAETVQEPAKNRVPDRAAENSPASTIAREEESRSSTDTIAPPVVSYAQEQKSQQSPPIEARDLSLSAESLRSENQAQREAPQSIKQSGEVRPADEMREDRRRSEKERTPVRSAMNSTELDDESSEGHKGPARHAPRNVRQIESQPSELRTDVRIAKQTTSDRHGPTARESTSVSAEDVTAVSAPAFEYSSSTERIVRPENVTLRGRADSPLRATTEDKRQGAQPSPTIKVNIGRIEVRAVMPPAPRAQEKALPAPRMSLDDYLKSVSGERR